MKKIIITIGVFLSLFSLLGFEHIEQKSEKLINSNVPKEKRDLLKKIVGRWITQTNIYAREGKPASKVIGSDVWQWLPDGNFLLHMAYGINNGNGFGAMEITGYNKGTGDFDSYNFHPDGNFSMGTLKIKNNVWIWEGEDLRSSGKIVRTTGEFDKEGKVLTVKHEISNDGKTYEIFMDGTLTKGSEF
jgi:hypothetical protein